jgi:outer membrane protein assembly factor BamB
VLIVSFIAGFISLPVVVPAIFRRPRLNLVFVAVGVACGLLAGQVLFGWWHGTDLGIDWTAPYDSSASLTTEGVWTIGDALIRVRADEVVSYQATTGRQQWSLTVPGLDVACAVSAGTGGQPPVGLIGYGTGNGACDNVLAVDLSTGRQLWSRQVTTGLSGNQGTGMVAIAGAAAVVVTEGGVYGLDPQTGALRWTLPSPSGCADQTAAVAGQSGVVLAACQQASFDVIDFDAATGGPLWQAHVAQPTQSYDFALLSADPVVVDDQIPGVRKVEHVITFGVGGRQESSILVSGISLPGGSAALDTDYYSGFGTETAVADGLLVGVTQPVNGESDIIAFRLSDGRRQWLVPMPDQVVSLEPDGGRLLFVDWSQPVASLETVAIPTGAVHPVGFIPQGVSGFTDASVYPAGGHYIVVNGSGVDPTSPIAAVGR